MGYTRNINEATRRRLYANSGNICAMYGCNNELIYENTANLSEICHIEAVNEDGARYNPNLSNEEVNSYDNLILLCPTCHKKVDSKQNETFYTVEYLKRMKADHESRVREAILEKPAIDMPILININVSQVVTDYNMYYEKTIEDKDVYKTVEKALVLLLLPLFFVQNQPISFVHRLPKLLPAESFCCSQPAFFFLTSKILVL